jgi:ATP synthase I subunit
MTTRASKTIQRRLFRLGVWLVLLGTLPAGFFFGVRVAISFVTGGALAALNFVWFDRIAAILVTGDPKVSKRRMLTGFFLRLLLLPLGLYVMIRFLFLSVPAAVAGLTVFYCSVFVEGILEAFETTSKRNART